MKTVVICMIIGAGIMYVLWIATSKIMNDEYGK